MKFYNNRYKFILTLALILSFAAISVYAIPVLDTYTEKLEKIDVEEQVEFDNAESEPVVSLSAADMFAGGDGTKNNPYLIADTYQLMNFAMRVNSYGGGYESAHYKLTKNIDLSNAYWTPVGYQSTSEDQTRAFSGTFDGAGYTISNFNISGTYETNNAYSNLGFFGYVENATLKNITLSNFRIDASTTAQYVFAGGLVGRFVADDKDIKSEINNCHIKNAVIKIRSINKLHGGGLVGFVTSTNSEFTIKNSSSDADCTFIVTDNKISNPDSAPQNTTLVSRIRVGGLVGFLGSETSDENTPAVITLENNASHSSLKTYFTDVEITHKNNSHTGGFIGSILINLNTKLDIIKNYSTNLIYSYGKNDVYSGGFAGYIDIRDNCVANINDCYTSTNVYTHSKENEAVLAGFSAVNSTANSENSVLNIKNVYTSSNLVDLGSKTLETVKTCGLYFENINVILENCYALKSTLHHYGDNGKLSEPEEQTLLENDQEAILGSYIGFNSSIWQIKSDSYPYPVLKNNYNNSIKYSVYTYVSERNLEIVPDSSFNYGEKLTVSDKAKTPESYYILSHWSVYPGGNNAEAQEYPVTGGLLLFPNFSDEFVSFDITFMSEGNEICKVPVKYSSEIVFPENPVKNDDSIYLYEFSHWSNTENGSAITESDKISTKNKTFYAVFKAIKKADWDGVSSWEFDLGNGTQESPYQITNAYHLYNLVQKVNQGVESYSTAYYVLTRNIDILGYEWTPIGTKDNPFEGHINGNGYSIYNFTVSNPETSAAGVFGYIKDAEIAKLSVKGFTIEVTNNQTVYAGGIAGVVTASSGEVSKISECITTGTVILDTNNAYSGGIAGYSKTATGGSVLIENCYSSAEITATGDTYSAVGGICAYFEASSFGASKIDKTYFSGSVEAFSEKTAYAGGITSFLLVNSSIAVNEASLAAASEGAILTNSFVIAKKISASNTATTSKAGTIYAHSGQSNIDSATVSNCAVLSTTNLNTTAKNKTDDKNVAIISTKSSFYGDKTSELFGFDFENVWESNTTSYPTLKAFSMVQSDFQILQFVLNKTNGTAKIELEILYREPNPYTVLAGIYNSNGKMIGFKTVTIDTPMESNKITLSFTNLLDISVCKLSVVDAITLELIEPVKTVSA